MTKFSERKVRELEGLDLSGYIFKKGYVMTFDIQYIRNQTYLNPHPKELMLRNCV
jgi:uncharacterized protein YbgA (DUF1722 family)